MSTHKLPFVEVTWNDAWVEGTDPVNLADVAASHKPQVIKTIGYMLLDDEAGISLANEHYEDSGIYRGRTFIPRAMVTRVTAHKLTKPRTKRVKAEAIPE